MTDQDKPVVLIAEDEASVAEGYDLWLRDRYETRLAADGQEALEMVDDTVDVVMLDRMMPKRSGEQVLREIRDRGLDCQVVMVTAVEPDFDVVEMGFDAYITKPPEREELIDTIEQLISRSTADEEFREYHSLMARKGAIEAEKTEEELAESEQYQALLDQIDDQREEVDDDLGEMDEEIEFVSAVREIEAGEDDEEFGVDEEDLADLDALDTHETEHQEPEDNQ
jgi:DNA-binding response OmpR family regulator